MSAMAEVFHVETLNRPHFGHGCMGDKQSAREREREREWPSEPYGRRERTLGVVQLLFDAPSKASKQ
jgi:hypothetical protein